MYDIIIVGAGPAGLTAGIYAARAGWNTVILEKSLAGGQVGLTSAMENYPGFPEGVGGPELATAMAEQALTAGAKIIYDGALEIDCAGKRVRTLGGWHEARALILALGAQPRRLGVPGEERLIGRGVSFCATCDGALYRGKRVAVVGGGNSAAEEALYLAGIGCDVLLIHRRRVLRAERRLAERVAASPRITTLWDTRVEAIEGEDRVERLLLQGADAEAVAAVFISIGRIPDTHLVAGQLRLDAGGFIAAGEDCHTSMPGVFAAGDTRTKRLRQVVTAVADGAVAAAECQELLEMQ